MYPASNWWNQDISAAPLDPSSAAFISFIGATRTLHPDFGPSPYGMPYVVVAGDQPLVQPVWTAYGDESDNGAPGRPAGYPIPPEAKTQPNYIEGAVPGGGLDGDRHCSSSTATTGCSSRPAGRTGTPRRTGGKPTAARCSI